eukprot:Gb_05536 [translate_table: standard]
MKQQEQQEGKKEMTESMEQLHTLTNGNASETEEITVVHPEPKKGIISSLIDLAEKLVVRTLYDSSKPLHYLSGNFAPVEHETPPHADLPVIGYLPECLNGEFVRVGPNPRFSPVAGYHWFDGDGYVPLPCQTCISLRSYIVSDKNGSINIILVHCRGYHLWSINV